MAPLEPVKMDQGIPEKAEFEVSIRVSKDQKGSENSQICGSEYPRISDLQSIFEVSRVRFTEYSDRRGLGKAKSCESLVTVENRNTLLLIHDTSMDLH